jgi:hypothetical protein
MLNLLSVGQEDQTPVISACLGIRGERYASLGYGQMESVIDPPAWPIQRRPLNVAYRICLADSDIRFSASWLRCERANAPGAFLSG